MNGRNWQHAHQRLTQAVSSMAISPKSLGQRLDHAYWHHLHGLHEDEIPSELAHELTTLKQTLAHALDLKEKDVKEAAKAIVDLHTKVWACHEEAVQNEIRRNAEAQG